MESEQVNRIVPILRCIEKVSREVTPLTNLEIDVTAFLLSKTFSFKLHLVPTVIMRLHEEDFKSISESFSDAVTTMHDPCDVISEAAKYVAITVNEDKVLEKVYRVGGNFEPYVVKPRFNKDGTTTYLVFARDGQVYNFDTRADSAIAFALAASESPIIFEESPERCDLFSVYFPGINTRKSFSSRDAAVEDVRRYVNDRW